MAQSCEMCVVSKWGGGGRPFVLDPAGCDLGGFGVLLLLLSREVEEAVLATRSRVREPRGESRVGRLMEGRTRRFCFEGGRISSKSTGTPRLTRKRRRMRLRVQFGGAMGGGERSCWVRLRLRGERKREGVLDEVGWGGSSRESEGSGVVGKMVERCWEAWVASSVGERAVRFRCGWNDKSAYHWIVMRYGRLLEVCGDLMSYLQGLLICLVLVLTLAPVVEVALSCLL